MEVRLLSTGAERKAFERGFTDARAVKARGFREKKSSRLSRLQLTFDDLYGVFEDGDRDSSRMIAGFGIHSLDQFGLTCPRPDLSYLPPETVFELDKLWSVAGLNGISIRAARALFTARAGCVIIPALKGAQALVIYAVTRRWDMTAVYPEFQSVGSPVRYPYLETLDGGPVHVQPMVLQGRALLEVMSHFWAEGFETNDDYSRIRIKNPFAVRHVELSPDARHEAAAASAATGGHALSSVAA